MQRRLRSWLALPVCSALLAVAACSTAPKQTDEVIRVKTQAAQDSTTGDGYLRQGRHALALQFYTQSLSEYTSIDDEAGIIASYNAVGRTAMAMGSLVMAEDMFTRARERSRTTSPSLLFVSTNNLGELFLVRGEAARALALFQEAIALPASARDPRQDGIARHNIGTAQKNLGNLAEALASYQASLEINLSKKFSEEAASDYYMIASVRSLQGDYGEADRNAQLALVLDKRIENSPGIGQDLFALGLIAKKRKDTAGSFDYFQRSYLVYTAVGMTGETKKVLGELAAAADALGRTEDAASYRKALADMGAS
jgi:tetratricopeptide (TPR) repeat protein